MSGDKNIFYDYNNNNYFIETGSYYGKGIQFAIDAGFKNILSIEITKKYFDLCNERFKNNTNVHIALGDSALILRNLIKEIDEPITFWLDGHYTDVTTEWSKTYGWFPLLQELELIKQHPIKTHTIIIDDVRCFNDKYGYFNQCKISIDMIKDKIKEINQNYNFKFIDGIIKDDVLVAAIGEIL
jgi:hypothetical protein